MIGCASSPRPRALFGWLAAAVIACAAGAAAQDSAAPQGSGEKRLIRLKVQRSATQSKFDAAVWKLRLQVADLDLREQAFEALVARCPYDGELRGAVESWAGDERDVGLAWTARLVLREVASTPALWLAAPIPGIAPEQPGTGGPMESRLTRPSGGARPPEGDAASPAARITLEAIRLDARDGSVTCESLELQDGQRVERTYQADSLAQLLEREPDLGEALARFASALDSSSLSLPRPRTDVLGVIVQALPAEGAAPLGVQPGVGLVVERVEAGTIASALGVRRGHILIECNGAALHTSEDLSRAVVARGPVEELRLVLVDRWGQARTRIWRPRAPAGSARERASQQRR